MSSGKKDNDVVMRARIETLDNGATMAIYRHSREDGGSGKCVLHKIYVDFASLVKDLEETMNFKWPK